MQINEEDLPADIDFSNKVWIQVTYPPLQSVVLYVSKYTEKHTRSYLPFDFSKGKDAGIFLAKFEK